MNSQIKGGEGRGREGRGREGRGGKGRRGETRGDEMRGEERRGEERRGEERRGEERRGEERRGERGEERRGEERRGEEREERRGEERRGERGEERRGEERRGEEAITMIIIICTYIVHSMTLPSVVKIVVPEMELSPSVSVNGVTQVQSHDAMRCWCYFWNTEFALTAISTQTWHVASVRIMTTTMLGDCECVCSRARYILRHTLPPQLVTCVCYIT